MYRCTKLSYFKVKADIGEAGVEKRIELRKCPCKVLHVDAYLKMVLQIGKEQTTGSMFSPHILVH